MSVQTTVGLFIETAPAAGQMRVLYKNTNGYDQVRAITISNVDINGNNVELSLDAVEQIRGFKRHFRVYSTSYSRSN